MACVKTLANYAAAYAPIVNMINMSQNQNIFFFAVILIIIILPSCKKDTNPIVSGPSNGANIILDFQSGFENDRLEIYMDDIPLYDLNISSDDKTNFAERIKIYTTPDSHNVVIKLNTGDVSLDTTLYVSDSLIIGIINDTLFKKLCIREFGSLPIYPVLDFNDFHHIEITYLNGAGYSNLMPPNPPDPVGIWVKFAFRNIYDKKIISGIYADEVYVYNISTDEFLGNIRMDYWPEIYLYAGKSDTITFYKIKEDHKLFEVPCRDSLYLLINFRDQYYRGIQIKTDNFFYDCDA